MKFTKETQKEYDQRIAEQDALWDMFEVAFPRNVEYEAPKLNDEVSDLEKRLIEGAMSVANKNRTKAAKALGISRENLIYKLKKYSIT